MNLFIKIDNYLNRRKHPFDISIARIIFFTYFLQHYRFQGDNSNWFQLAWESHWLPVSFFQIFPMSWNTPQLYVVFNYMMLLGGAFALVGLFTQLSIVCCFIGALFGLGFQLNFGKIHHSNHFVVMTLFFLSFTQNHCLSLDFYLKKYLRKFTLKKVRLFETRCWPLVGLAIYMCTAYCESGFQKLKNNGFNWFHPDNLSLIILTRPSITEFGRWASEQSWLMAVLAFITIVIEFGAPIALFNKKLFYFFGFSLFCFHFGTLLLLGVHGDFRAYSVCFVFWVPWGTLYHKLKIQLKKLIHI